MSKLPEKHQFLDLSDYGRSLGHLIATKLQNTSITPIHVTTMFIITGFIAIWLLLNGYLITSAFLLLLKSILDAADGDLARLKKKPSYVGRYYASLAAGDAFRKKAYKHSNAVGGLVIPGPRIKSLSPLK